VKDAFLDGTEVLAKGIFCGVTGVVVKPYEGAVRGGVAGFATGVSKGFLGAVTQPTSGVLDALSKAAEAASAAYTKVNVP
jgi:vacuolar protein sorting-associated protein 13A/C